MIEEKGIWVYLQGHLQLAVKTDSWRENKVLVSGRQLLKSGNFKFLLTWESKEGLCSTENERAHQKDLSYVYKIPSNKKFI